MSKPEKNRQAKVTPENLEESARLRALWELHQPRLAQLGYGTQELFGAKFNIGGQAAVGHFLNGRSPISLKAALGFSRGLGVPVADFSPRLALLVDSGEGEDPSDWRALARALAAMNPDPSERALLMAFCRQVDVAFARLAGNVDAA